MGDTKAATEKIAVYVVRRKMHTAFTVLVGFAPRRLTTIAMAIKKEKIYSPPLVCEAR